MKVGDLVRFKSSLEPSVGIVWKVTKSAVTGHRQYWILYRENDPPAWAPEKYLEVVSESR